MAIPSAASPARTVSPYLLLTLTPFFWACDWIVGRGLHAEIPPLAMTFYRWAFAIVFMLPFALPRVRRQWPLIRVHWRVVLLLLGVLASVRTTRSRIWGSITRPQPTASY